MNDLNNEASEIFRNANCLYDRPAVEAVFDRMAMQINRDMAGKEVLVLCVMNGGLVTAGMLLPRLSFLLRIDYLHASRYREQTSGDELHWKANPTHSLEGRDLLIIDDILDEGYTLDAIIRHCQSESPASVRAAVLVQKRHDRGVRPAIDYIGLTVPDRYVFGYGMDYKGYWRNAPGIYAVAD